MSTAAERPHLSIGEVLSQLRSEFPDITISKIRFLESQGLLDPERTPSGYRKFYEGDVERLRWILHQQKEHFLPLKVIKGRLEQLELGDGSLAVPADADQAPAEAMEAEARVETKRASSKSRRRKAAESPVPMDDGRADDLVGEASGVSLTRAELGRASGLGDDELATLEEFGLLAPSSQAGERVLFDEESLAVARFASGFFKHGIEPRHLRMYRNFAEREATLFGQVLLPVLRQRNPESRARAQEQLAELARLGRGLRTAYLRQAVRDAFDD
ncbi:MAG: MerR family transcriptional regulator [Acidimicrobiia bacterium]